MKTTRLVSWIAVVIGMALPGSSVPIPAMSVAALAERADLVVVGEIVSVTQKDVRTITVSGVSVAARLLSAEVRVEQTIKGSYSAPTLVVEFDLPDEQLGYGTLSSGSWRTLFLKQKGSSYTFVSPYYPSLIATQGVPLQNGSVLEKVSHQLDAVVRSADASIAQKHEALYALGSVKIPVATNALRHALNEPSTELQLMASAALLERNDIGGLSVAEEALSHPPAAVPGYLILNIAYSIRTGLQDPQAIPALTRFMRLPGVDIRRAAAAALQRTGSAAATPGLMSALNDPDFEVRYSAVIGLAEITGDLDWHPNQEVFHAEETKYLQHWRDWVSTNYPARQNQP
jgi:hypothetical protein